MTIVTGTVAATRVATALIAQVGQSSWVSPLFTARNATIATAVMPTIATRRSAKPASPSIAGAGGRRLGGSRTSNVVTTPTTISAAIAMKLTIQERCTASALAVPGAAAESVPVK